MDLGGVLSPPPPPRPRSVGEVVTVSLRAYARWWTELAPLAAVFVVPGQLLLVVVERALGDAGAPRGPEGAASTPAMLAVLLVALVSLVLGTVQQGAVTWAAMRALLGGEPTLGRAIRVGVRRLWSVLLVGLLTGLATLVGLVLLVIPGLIVVVRLAVVMPVLIVEGARGRAALRRSWRLVRGRSWPAAGVLLVVVLLSGLVGAVVSLLVEGVGLPPEVSAAVASILWTPLYAVLVGALYIDLRARELASTEALAAELERATP